MNKQIFVAICCAIVTFGVIPSFADSAPTDVNHSQGAPANPTAPTNPTAQATPPAQPTQINWFTNYQQAVQEAARSHKPLLLFFTGSDWCGWCKKMQQEIFSSPEFASQVGTAFVFVDVDFPMNQQLPADHQQQNTQLKQKYGVTGYPTIIILDSNENFIAETGYRPGGGKAYADYLRTLLQY